MTTLFISTPETEIEAQPHFYMVRLCVFSYYE